MKPSSASTKMTSRWAICCNNSPEHCYRDDVIRGGRLPPIDFRPFFSTSSDANRRVLKQVRSQFQHVAPLPLGNGAWPQSSIGEIAASTAAVLLAIVMLVEILYCQTTVRFQRALSAYWQAH